MKHILAEGDDTTPDSEAFALRRNQTLDLLEKLQSAAGWKPGWRREELSKLLATRSGNEDGFYDLLDGMVTDGLLVCRGSAFSTATYQPALPDPLEAAARQLEENLLADGVAPRDWELALSQVCADPKGFAMLSEHLLGLGRLEKLTDKLVFSPVALAQAREVLRQRSAGAPFTTSQAKEWLDISRKFIIALLEWMDGVEWTCREGDERILKG